MGLWRSTRGVSSSPSSFVWRPEPGVGGGHSAGQGSAWGERGGGWGARFLSPGGGGGRGGDSAGGRGSPARAPRLQGGGPRGGPGGVTRRRRRPRAGRQLRDLGRARALRGRRAGDAPWRRRAWEAGLRAPRGLVRAPRMAPQARGARLGDLALLPTPGRSLAGPTLQRGAAPAPAGPVDSRGHLRPPGSPAAALDCVLAAGWPLLLPRTPSPVPGFFFFLTVQTAVPRSLTRRLWFKLCFPPLHVPRT